MSERTIFLDAPRLGALEKQYLNQAIDGQFVSTAGPFVPEFETAFAKFIGVNEAVTTQSGSAAIHLALYESGIGLQARFCADDCSDFSFVRNDEVIVPALTFAATTNPILQIGAIPVFVDVDRETWNIDVEAVESAITERTRAILPVHLYGNPCHMDGLMAIARKYDVPVIEDATESLGATHQGRYTGTFGDLGAFSFNGNKLITTGGGGMVIGRDDSRLTHIRFLANQARDAVRGYYHPEVGFNYRMTNLEAALGLAQMQQLEEFLSKKRRFNAIYRQELSSLQDLRFQEPLEGSLSAYWLTCILLENDIDIAELQHQLKDRGVPTRRVFVPIIEFPPYRQYAHAAFPNACHIYERGLCLPSSTLNTEDDIAYVCRVLHTLLA